MNKPRPSIDLKAIASRFRVTVRTARNWRLEGAPLHDLPALRSWLSGRKFLTVEVPAPEAGTFRLPATMTPTDVELAGIAPALRRLERAEVAAYDCLQQAIASTDPLAIRAARDSWLKIGDSLRRYDANVEQARRDVGALRPTSELVEAMEMLLCGMTAGIEIGGGRLADEICLMVGDTQHRTAIAELLREKLWQVYRDFIPCCFAEGQGSWAKDLVKMQLATRNDRDLFQRAALYSAVSAVLRGEKSWDVSVRELFKETLPPFTEVA